MAAFFRAPPVYMTTAEAAAKEQALGGSRPPPVVTSRLTDAPRALAAPAAEPAPPAVAVVAPSRHALLVTRYRASPELRRGCALALVALIGASLLIAGLAARSVGLSLVGVFIVIPAGWGAGVALHAYRTLETAQRADAYWDLEASLPAHAYGGLGAGGGQL